MLKSFQRRQTAALGAVLLLMFVCFGRTAFADSYSIRSVLSTQKENFAGGDDYGNYTINITNTLYPGSTCGGVVSTACYETHYVNSPVPVFTVTPPPLWDNPNPIAGLEDCSLYVGNKNILCNNGHALYFGFQTLPDGSEIRGIFAGADPDPVKDYLSSGSFDGGFMTPNGNAYFIDGLHDTLDIALNLSAIPTPVPEPQSLLLLGTGGIFVLGRVRRRFVSSTRLVRFRG